MRFPLLTAIALGLAISVALSAQMPTAPEDKAVAYLVKEVPKWHAEQGCYSCHNNGDAARALLMASFRGHDIGDALTDTLRFLERPADWASVKLVREDRRPLSRLSFAAALAAAGEKDLNPGPALVEAAKLLEGDQQADGSWAPDVDDAAGTPVTYGTAVATWLARATLITAGKQPDDFGVAQADRWLRTVEVVNVTDAAGVLLAMGVTSDVMADKQRALALSILRRAHQESGGWGPVADGPPTVFHTALALMALQQYEADPRLARSTYRLEELQAAIARTRAYLAAQQHEDGSWPETLKAGAKPSYAQRISTTSWALMALLHRAP